MQAATAGSLGRYAPRNDGGAFHLSRRQLGPIPVPTLFRFLFILGVLAGLVYAGMIALVANVKVEPREMTQIVALPKAPP